MKKYLIFFIPLVIVVIMDNFDTFKQGFHAYIANSMYHKNNFIEASKKYEEIESMGGEENRNAILYNRANTQYKLKNYTGSLRAYQEIVTEDPEKNYRIRHNMGNAYYRLGQDAETNTGKILLWSKSLEEYLEALKITNEQDTRENYEFVKKKLQELLRQEEQEKNGTGTGESKSGSGAAGESGNPAAGNWKNSGSYNGIGESGDAMDELGARERRELEEYTRQLQELQNDRSRYMKEGESANQGGSRLQEFFGNDPQFESLFPGNSGEKDW